MKNIAKLVLVGASLLGFMTCDSGNSVNTGNATGDPSDPGNTESVAFKVADVTPKALPAPVYGSIDPGVKTAATGANDFAFRLGAALIDDYRGKNFVVSPFSVWMPLAALANVSAEHFTEAHLTALGAVGVSVDDINKAAARMLYDLTNAADSYNPHNPLSIVNAVFVDNTVTLTNNFAQTYMDYYRGGSINVDFRSREAVDAVNRWASENTNGLITDLIQEFDPLTIVAIANAIYFSDRWSREFNPEQTAKGEFHAPDGISQADYMLRESYTDSYYEDNKVQAINLPFSQPASGLYILLPQPGVSVEELFSTMTAEYFNTIQQTVLAEGKLLLPRFSVENSIKLMEGLEALGIPLLEEGSIRGLIEKPTGPMLVTEATQKALIKVDEKGTTAAAVTVIGVGADSVPTPVTSFEMVCDRPFMFILYGRTYEGGSQVLFTGIVNKP